MRDIILEIGKVVIYVFFLAVLVLEPFGIYITGTIGMLVIAYVIGDNIVESIINIIENIKIKKSHKNNLTTD